MEAPESLEDSEVLPSLLSFKDLPSSKSSGASSKVNTGLKGSKRANALVGNIGDRTTSSEPKPLKSIHRSTSFPGRRNQSSSPSSGSTRFISSTVSESGADRFNQSIPMSQKSMVSSRMNKFKKISSTQQQLHSNLPLSKVDGENRPRCNRSRGNVAGGVPIYSDMSSSSYDAVEEGDSNTILCEDSAGSSHPSLASSRSVPVTGKSSTEKLPLYAHVRAIQMEQVGQLHLGISTNTTTLSPESPVTAVSQGSPHNVSFGSVSNVPASRDPTPGLRVIENSMNDRQVCSLHGAAGPDELVVSSSAPDNGATDLSVHSSLASHSPAAPSAPAPQESVSDEDAARSSMCFSLDGRVTSVAATSCGSYVVAGFASGAVKLFELSCSGNTDLEDRFGYLLGYMNTSSNQGTLRVHVEAGSAPATTDSGPSSHVFAGARLGSTSVFATDIQSLHRLKKKRGFITMAGGDVKTFKHSDLRLRGFCSVSTVSQALNWSPPQTQEGQCDQLCASCREERGYTAIYRLLCGAGYGVFSIWQVVFTATPSCVLHDSPGGRGSTGSSHDVAFKYTQAWSVLYSASMNCPSVLCGVVLRSSDNGERANSRMLEYIAQGIGKDARVHQIPLSLDANGVVDIQAAAVEHKHRTLRGISSLHAASEDGTVLFTGLDELVIYRLSRRCSSFPISEGDVKALDISEVHCFSLSELSSTCRGKSGPSRRGGRHLRQIEEISCTPDGNYAVIRCSDGAVVLYSAVDVFGVGIGPVRIEQRQSPDSVSPSSATPLSGVVTLWYQAVDTVGFRVSISYTDSPTNAVMSGESDELAQWMAEHGAVNGIRHPSSVLVLTGWWPLYSNHSREGVLKADRLCLPHTRQSPVLSKKSEIEVDLTIAKPGIGLASSAIGNCSGPISSSVSSARKGCWLCGSANISHWPELIAEGSDDEGHDDGGSVGGDDVDLSGLNTSRNSNIKKGPLTATGNDVRGGKRRKTSDNVSSLSTAPLGVAGTELFPADEECEGTVDIATKGESRKRARSTGAAKNRQDIDLASSVPGPSVHQVRLLQKQVSALESELNSTREKVRQKEKECVILVRKFDRRFAKEMECRRLWNSDRSRLEEKVRTLESTVSVMQARAVEAENANAVLMQAMAPLYSLLNATNGGGAIGGVGSLLNVGGVTAPLMSGTQGVRPSNMPSSTIPTAESAPKMSGPGPSTPLRATETTRHVDGSHEAVMQAPFCVVCQAYTADTVVLNCGHMCLCYMHALQMQGQGQLRTCPLCKARCSGICRAQGIQRDQT